jgi:hypothetical protein
MILWKIYHQKYMLGSKYYSCYNLQQTFKTSVWYGEYLVKYKNKHLLACTVIAKSALWQMCIWIWSTMMCPRMQGTHLERKCTVLEDTLLKLWSCAGIKNFHFSILSRQILGAPNLFTIGTWVLYQWVKWPGHKADHSLPTSAKVKKMWVYTSNPPYLLWCSA